MCVFLDGPPLLKALLFVTDGSSSVCVASGFSRLLGEVLGGLGLRVPPRGSWKFSICLHVQVYVPHVLVSGVLFILLCRLFVEYRNPFIHFY